MKKLIILVDIGIQLSGFLRIESKIYERMWCTLMKHIHQTKKEEVEELRAHYRIVFIIHHAIKK
jgi:hypothetical protein